MKNEIHVGACPWSVGNKIARWLSCSNENNEKYDKKFGLAANLFHRFFWRWNKVVVKPKIAANVFRCRRRHGSDVKNIIDFFQGFIERKSPGDSLGSDSNAVRHTLSLRLGARSCAQMKRRFEQAISSPDSRYAVRTSRRCTPLGWYGRRKTNRRSVGLAASFSRRVFIAAWSKFFLPCFVRILKTSVKCELRCFHFHPQ